MIVTDFGAVGDGETDDTSAFIAAHSAAKNNFDNTGIAQKVYVPSGVYKISAPFAGSYIREFISYFGDGPVESILKITKDFSGTVFPYSNVWAVTAQGVPVFSPAATSAALAKRRLGVSVQSLGITGDRTSVNEQVAIGLFDAVDQFTVKDVMVSFFPGRVIWAGVTRQNTTRGCFRESTIRDFRCYSSGAPGNPVVEINSDAGSEGSNEIVMDNINIFAPYDKAISFRAQKANCGIYRLSNIRREGIQPQFGNNIQADLLSFGHPDDEKNTSDVCISNLKLLNPYPGFSAIKIDKGGLTTDAPYQIYIGPMNISSSTPGMGNGVTILAGRRMNFMGDIVVKSGALSVIVGPSSGGVQGFINFNCGGGGPLTWNIDPTSIGKVTIPSMIAAP